MEDDEIKMESVGKGEANPMKVGEEEDEEREKNSAEKLLLDD